MIVKKIIIFGLTCGIFWLNISTALYSQNIPKPNFRELKKEAENQKENPTIVISNQNFPLWLEKHYKRVFDWSYYSTIIIFIIVMTLVLSGLYFSYTQFKNSLINSKGKQEDSLANNIYIAEKTELKINKDGIEVSSSVIGLITLIISIAFLYLYLVHVHPIKVLNLQQTQPLKK